MYLQLVFRFCANKIVNCKFICTFFNQIIFSSVGKGGRQNRYLPGVYIFLPPALGVSLPSVDIHSVFYMTPTGKH
jgi:hypothetical protein